jgi:hypothetical protein
MAEKDKKISAELINDTVNYLARQPYGVVKDLISRWEEAFKPEETEQE